MTKKQALRDLKSKVRSFMRAAEKMAMEKIDRIQAAGVDIAADHINGAGPYEIPRDFIAAFSDEIKYQYGMLSKHMPQSQKRRIKNYSLMM